MEDNFVNNQVSKAKVSTKAIKVKKGWFKGFIINRLTILIIGGILGLIGGYFIFVYYGIGTQKVVISAEQIAQQKLMDEYIANMSKLMILPKGEVPVMATVTNAENLAKDQVFYADAQNGDIIFVYEKAMKAIIYNPTKNIIVNVGPVYYKDDTNTPPAPIEEEEQ